MGSLPQCLRWVENGQDLFAYPASGADECFSPCVVAGCAVSWRIGMNTRVFIQTMIALASVSLGLVAALAWNEAIKATLDMLGLGNDLAGLYSYAIIATLIAVIVLVWLGRIAARVDGEAASLDG